MRDYSKVSGQFWTGTTGKALRGDTLTQLLAMYLMTSPHANMIGVFHCPVLYMAHEIGSPIEGASESLRKLIKAAFCMYDDASETVFVKNMAKFQIGEQLDPKDKRVSGIQKLFDSLSDSAIKTAFYEHYKTAFCLKPLASPLQAPTKPEAGTEAGTGTEKKARSIAFSQWIESCKAEGKTPIPEDHHVFEYAKRVGIPDDFLALAWFWFEKTYSEKPKKYIDWPTVFRKAVEGNWPKLWFIDANNQYTLTTAGKQLQMEAK